MKKKTMALAAGMLGLMILFLPGQVDAALTSEGPFVGSLTESWESFDNFLVSASYYLPMPTAIMGGLATISSPRMAVYEPLAPANFGLGSSGTAQVADGRKAMGLDTFAQTATISFLNPVSDFGAYWGANTPPSPAMVTLGLSDASTANFTYEQAGTGVLDWHGWHSTVGITSISYSGDYVVIDGLQANVAATPEPAGLTLLALGAGACLSVRRRRARD